MVAKKILVLTLIATAFFQSQGEEESRWDRNRKRALGNYHDLNKRGQELLPKTPVQEAKKIANDLFKPFEKAEDKVVNVFHSTFTTILGVCILLAGIFFLAAICLALQCLLNCYHKMALRRHVSNAARQGPEHRGMLATTGV